MLYYVECNIIYPWQMTEGTILFTDSRSVCVRTTRRRQRSSRTLLSFCSAITSSHIVTRFPRVVLNGSSWRPTGEGLATYRLPSRRLRSVGRKSEALWWCHAQGLRHAAVTQAFPDYKSVSVARTRYLTSICEPCSIAKQPHGRIRRTSSKHRTTEKNRVHKTLRNSVTSCPSNEVLSNHLLTFLFIFY